MAYLETAGKRHTTEVNPAYNDPANWTRSAFGGSPGGVNVGIDTTPPGTPSDLSAVATGGLEIELTWTATTDEQSGIGSYNIYRNDVHPSILGEGLVTYVRSVERSKAINDDPRSMVILSASSYPDAGSHSL